MKHIEDIFHKNYLKVTPFILLFSVLLSALASLSRVFSILSFLIIIINAVYILGKIMIYKMSKRRME